MKTLDFPSEKFVEEYVCETISETGVCPVSNESVDAVFSQFNLREYGITDVLKVDFSPDGFSLTVLELKNEPLKPSHIAQLCRYMAGIEIIASRYHKAADIDVRGQLAGPLSLSNDLVFLVKWLDANIEIFDIGMSIDEGFYSNHIKDGWAYRVDDSLKKSSARKIFNAFCDWNQSEKEAAVELSLVGK